jgi:hypothetical protein
MIQAGHLRRADSPLSGHKLVSIQYLGDEDRLEHAMNRDAGGELLEGVLLDPLARLIWVAADTRNRNLDGYGSGGAGLRDQGTEPTSEADVSLRVGRRHRGSESAITAAGGGALGVVAAAGRSAGGFAIGARPSRARNSAARRAYASAPLESGL